VEVTGHHLLADAAFAGDQDGGFGAGDLIGQFDDGLHRRIGRDQGALVVGDRGQDGGDQVGLGRKGDELLGPRADGGGSLVRIVVDPAGDHRHEDALGLVGGDQRTDVEIIVDHQEVGPLAAPELFRRLVRAFDVIDLGAVRHGHLHRRRQLSAEPSDHQKPHGSSPLTYWSTRP